MEPGTHAGEWGADRVYPDGSFMFFCHLFGYQDLAGRLRPGSTVLDLACGEGYGAAAIEHSRVVALDIETDVLGRARVTYPHVGFVAGDALRLPFGDGTFDAVAALQVIEHLVETDAFLSEITRVMDPDGFVYLATPNIDRLPNMARKEFNPHHVRDFTPDELRSALAPHFEDVTLYGQTLDPSLPRTQALVEAAAEEWKVMPRVERIERMVRHLPGPVRVRSRRALLRLAAVGAWPLPAAEKARAAIRAEDFRATEPAEESGNTLVIARRPRRRGTG